MVSENDRDTRRVTQSRTTISVPKGEIDEVAEIAKVLKVALAKTKGRRPKSRFVGPDGESSKIPHSVLQVMAKATESLARGDSVSVVRVDAELTTKQAADILNVSRQYLVRLIEEGALPARRTGSHRRVQLQDVLAYKKMRDRRRRAALRKLVRITEEAGGYGWQIDDHKRNESGS